MTVLAPTVRRPLDATDIARAGIFAAVIAVLGLPGAFTILGAVPITAQTLGVMLAGAILGPAVGALSVTAVIVLVAAGLPLLAGGRGGIGVFFSPTGGYLLGWLVGVVVIGLVVHLAGRRPVWWRTFLGTLVGGVLVVYAVGIPVQALVLRIGLGEAALSSLVFLPGDLIKVVATTLIVGALVRGYPRAFRRQWRSRAATAAP